MGQPSPAKSDSSTRSDYCSSIASADVNKRSPFPSTFSQPSIPGTDGSVKMSPPPSPSNRIRPMKSLTSDNPKRAPWYKRMLKMNSKVNLKEHSTHFMANDQLPPPPNFNISSSDCTEDPSHDIIAKTTTSEIIHTDAPMTTDPCPPVTKPLKNPTTTPVHTFNDSRSLTKDDGHTNAEIMEVGTTHPARMNNMVGNEQSASPPIFTVVLSQEPVKSSEETKNSPNDVTMPTMEDEQTDVEIMQTETSHPTLLPTSYANKAVQTEQSASHHSVSIIPSPESAKSSDEIKDNIPTQSKSVTFHTTSLPPASLSNHSVQLEQSTTPSADSIGPTSDPVKGSWETRDSFQESTSFRKDDKFEFRFEDVILSEIDDEDSDQYDDMMEEARGERLKYVMRLVPKVYPPLEDVFKPGFDLQNIYRDTYGPKIILRGDIKAPVPEWIFIEDPNPPPKVPKHWDERDLSDPNWDWNTSIASPPVDYYNIGVEYV